MENTTAIDYFQSKQFCKFINTLLFLPIVLLSANKEEKQVIVSILYGCMNNTILPTIKKIAESNLNLIYNQGSLCRWNYCFDNDHIIKSNKRKRVSNAIISLSDCNKKENQMYVNTANFEAYLEVINKMNMNELFEFIYKRRTVIDYVLPLSNKNSLSFEKTELRNELIPERIVAAVNSASIRIIEWFKGIGCMNRKPHSTINIIIDTNCSLRKNKLRMRTIISIIIVTVMKELGILFNLYVLCGRYKGVCVSMENRSVHEIISFLFDIEGVVKMPSTPLDLLTVSDQLKSVFAVCER